MDAIAQRSLMRNMSDIDAAGLQKAYESAGTMFGADRAARMDVDAARAAELGRVETGTEASRQFGAGQGLAALDAAGRAGEALVGLGEKERRAAIENATMLESIGKDKMLEEQAAKDVDYQDWLQQNNYAKDNLAFYSEFLRGLPVANAGESTSTSSIYTNPVKDVVGAGLTGLGLYKAYG
jgi:hypothetical protein